MAQLVKRITLSALNNIEIERGIVLPAGSYAGYERQAGIEQIDRTFWREPEYKIEFTMDQLDRISTSNPANLLLSKVYDVTHFVRMGDLKITERL
jgi:hypothetical protein